VETLSINRGGRRARRAGNDRYTDCSTVKGKILSGDKDPGYVIRDTVL